LGIKIAERLGGRERGSQKGRILPNLKTPLIGVGLVATKRGDPELLEKPRGKRNSGVSRRWWALMTDRKNGVRGERKTRKGKETKRTRH